MTSISTNFAPNATPAFQKNTAQPKIDTKPKEKTGMSTAAKVGIGAAAVATSVIAGLVIKNKSAAKALMKEAKNLGFENVETYKNAKTFFNDIKKCDEFSYEDVFETSKKLYKEGKIVAGDQINYLSPAKTKESFGKGIPENAFSIVYVRGEEKIYSELINPKQIRKDLHDLCDAQWNKGGIFTQNFSKGK